MFLKVISSRLHLIFRIQLSAFRNLTMKSLPFLAFIFVYAVGLVDGRCAPRSVHISYKSDSGNTIAVYRLCSGKERCGSALVTLRSGCTKIGCIAGTRCNTCFTKLSASDLPNDGQGKYGIFFDDEPLPFYKFFADWTNTGDSSWYSRNGWIAGCKPRVGCVTRGPLCGVRDVSISAQGCYTTLFRNLNADNLGACASGKLRYAVPKGEIYGKDCPSQPL